MSPKRKPTLADLRQARTDLDRARAVVPRLDEAEARHRAMLEDYEAQLADTEDEDEVETLTANIDACLDALDKIAAAQVAAEELEEDARARGAELVED